MMIEAPRGKANEMYNRDEKRVSGEVYDLYCFLHAHPSMAPNRRKDVLRASVNFTPFGYIFGGLVSVRAANLIDRRISENAKQDLCLGMQRDHFNTWKETSHFFFSVPLMARPDFWLEMKRRNEIVLLLKEEHSKVGPYQRLGHGQSAYGAAGIELIRIDPRALLLRGNKAALARQHWPESHTRTPFSF